MISVEDRKQLSLSEAYFVRQGTQFRKRERELSETSQATSEDLHELRLEARSHFRAAALLRAFSQPLSKPLSQSLSGGVRTQSHEALPFEIYVAKGLHDTAIERRRWRIATRSLELLEEEVKALGLDVTREGSLELVTRTPHHMLVPVVKLFVSGK